MVYFSELDIKWNLDQPLSVINKVVEKLNEEPIVNCRILILIDEVWPVKENESWNDFEFELSFLDLSRSNIDLLMALNPADNFQKSFKFIPSKHPNNLQKQLTVKHRNNFETAVFLDHWMSWMSKYKYCKYGYLDSSNDMPLDPNYLPPGRLPLWVPSRKF